MDDYAVAKKCNTEPDSSNAIIVHFHILLCYWLFNPIPTMLSFVWTGKKTTSSQVFQVDL